MRLHPTTDNPIPPGVVVSSLRADDGALLRAARWVPPGAARGTVAILNGRAEFIEKYFEVVAQLLDRGFAVATFDWRGQGGSARQLANPRKGHIDDFSVYSRDFAAFVDDVVATFCPKPWFGLAHSMGAAILLTIAHAGRCPFERMALTAPMVGLAGLRAPRAAHWLALGLDSLGLGGAFAPGGGNESVSTQPFAGNILTSDPRRYARMAASVQVAPEIGLGWPTVSWVHAAFRVMKSFEEPEYARAIDTPSLIVAAGADLVVDTRAAERFAARLRTGHLIVVAGAEHEILMERDELRGQFWAAFDAFIPGAEGASARVA